MTPQQREAALRLSDRLMRSLTNDMVCVVAAAALLRELAAAPQGEPVAWHVCSVNSDGSLSLEFAAPWEELAHEHINDAINEHDIDGATSWVVRPVYASPQPQQTEPSQDTHPQRQPLTGEQMEAGMRSFDWGPVPHPFRTSVAFERGVRFAEKAHGIGEPK